jgi:hypothetical protein
VSIDTLERHIQPSLRIIRVGRLRLIPVTELARWCDQHAEHTIQPRRAA